PKPRTPSPRARLAGTSPPKPSPPKRRPKPPTPSPRPPKARPKPPSNAAATRIPQIFLEVAMESTASMVKELRERTGAGMMECKKALTEAGGNIDAAAEALRKSGLAKADKKADRVAAEGRIAFAQQG